MNLKNEHIRMVPNGSNIWIPEIIPIFPNVIYKNYQKKGEKSGGQISKSEYGGVYNIKIENKKYTVLFKQGRNDGETICEYLASKIYELIIPGYAAKVFLAKARPNSDTLMFNINLNLHYEIYIGTVFFEEFNEIFKLMGFQDRPIALQTRYPNKCREFINKFKSTNLGEILAAALWLGDYDVHIANLGAVSWNKDTQHYLEKWGAWTNEKYWKNSRLVKIDHGWSFADIEDKMNLNKTPWKLFKQIGKPTNHYSDYKFCNLYQDKQGSFINTISKLKELSKEQISSTLIDAFKELNEFYGKNGSTSLSLAVKSTAKWIGLKANSNDQNEIIKFLTEKLYQRAQNRVLSAA